MTTDTTSPQERPTLRSIREAHQAVTVTANARTGALWTTCTGCDWTSCANSPGTVAAAHKRHVKAVARKAGL